MIGEFMCSSAGQTLCLILFFLMVPLYIACIIIEEKWG